MLLAEVINLKTVAIAAILCVVNISGSAFAANDLLVNRDFEVSEGTTGYNPDVYNDWQGDLSSITIAQDGIIPYEGVQMLNFMGSRDYGADPISFGCEIWQILDISSISSQILSGNAVLHGEAYFNRVAGDQETDTMFNVQLAAYSGLISDFGDKWNNRDYLAVIEDDILSDSNVLTWEKAEVNLLLPDTTDYVVLRIGATENIVNDPIYPEFDGHYVDAASVTLIPAPTAVSLLLAAAGFGLNQRRRRS